MCKFEPDLKMCGKFCTRLGRQLVHVCCRPGYTLRPLDKPEKPTTINIDMTSSIFFWATFALLFLAIGSALLYPSDSVRGGVSRLWLPLYVAAAISGLAGTFLQWSALLSIAALFAMAYTATRPSIKPAIRILLTVLILLLSLAMAVHAVPDYLNPVLVKDVRFSELSTPFTSYANFDKGTVGLVLLLFFCRRSSSWKDFLSACRQQAPVFALLVVTVFALGFFGGFIRPDPKLPAFLPIFAATNLLLTCVAEEAFFRGLIQERISGALAGRGYGEAVAVTVSALLFGVVHAGGGIQYVMLATTAGFGYAWLYSRSRRIELPILAHFAVNLIHFILFTYPRAI